MHKYVCLFVRCIVVCIMLMCVHFAISNRPVENRVRQPGFFNFHNFWSKYMSCTYRVQRNNKNDNLQLLWLQFQVVNCHFSFTYQCFLTLSYFNYLCFLSLGSGWMHQYTIFFLKCTYIHSASFHNNVLNKSLMLPYFGKRRQMTKMTISRKRTKCVCHFHWRQWNIMMSLPIIFS